MTAQNELYASTSELAIDTARRGAAAAVALRCTLIERLHADQQGEGVISTAIAVLIMAFIGVAAFALFDTIMQKAQD